MRYRASKATIKQEVGGEWKTVARCFGGDPETNEDRAAHMAKLLDRSYLLTADHARLVEALGALLEPDSLGSAVEAATRAQDLLAEIASR